MLKESSLPLVRKAALAVFVFLALFSTAGAVRWSWKLLESSPYPDEITLEDHRLAPLLEIVSPGLVVGYITDLPYPAPLRDVPMTIRYYWAQYALAPVIIQRNPSRPLLLGNFSNEAVADRFRADPSLEVVADFGGGLVLFVRGGG